MAKFVIPCPRCGSYTEARKGLFAKRKIPCACGHIIDIKAERTQSKICPHCGNTVLYDQRDGENAKCPICHKEINTLEAKSRFVDFYCPSCSCKLTAEKNATTYECPLCETVIDVQSRLRKEEIKNKGLASVIKYEGGNDVFVWKHPIEDFNLGSQLIVHESQEAIFFRDGKALDLFGSGRYTLATQNLPLLENLYKLPANAETVFHSEVYFINMTTQMGIKWGTDSKVRLFDPASGLHIEIGACGSFNLRVSNSRKLLVKLVGTTGELTQRDIAGTGGVGNDVMSGKFRSLVMNRVKANLAKAIKENSINILEIDSYVDLISEKLKDILNENLDDYGLYIPEFFITNIITPDDDPNFRRLKTQFAEKILRVREEEIRKAEAEAAQGRKILEAQTEAQLKVLGARGDAEAIKIKAMAEAEAYRAQAMAEADEMKAKGYTYAQETSRQIGLSAMQNGITGNGNGGIGGSLGDIAELGVTLGAMGSVIGMTKDAFTPMMNDAAKMGSAVGASVVPGADGWSCTCGRIGITSRFCPECGSPKPAPVTQGWSCACGKTGITSKFCPECGAKKPERLAWDCACGKTGITSNFCPECGAKKPE